GRPAPGTGAAFRDLLLPGHRVLPARRAHALRTRRAGRAQDRARLPAHAGAQPPLDRRPGFPPRTARLVPGRGIGGRCDGADADAALAVPRPGDGDVTRALPALLDPDPDAPFPDPETALREPDGLLAIGGDLGPRRL